MIMNNCSGLEGRVPAYCRVPTASATALLCIAQLLGSDGLLLCHCITAVAELAPAPAAAAAAAAAVAVAAAAAAAFIATTMDEWTAYGNYCISQPQ